MDLARGHIGTNCNSFEGGRYTSSNSGNKSSSFAQDRCARSSDFEAKFGDLSPSGPSFTSTVIRAFWTAKRRDLMIKVIFDSDIPWRNTLVKKWHFASILETLPFRDHHGPHPVLQVDIIFKIDSMESFKAYFPVFQWAELAEVLEDDLMSKYIKNIEFFIKQNVGFYYRESEAFNDIATSDLNNMVDSDEGLKAWSQRGGLMYGV
ncbi:hypothetical protein CPB84DRAFT_1750802 [Gymnopilus junonius]|uniref:Uncharacterized protein n=1 Tax=Gymnopilus junonius TaxID=109634 RepID=A0A9P5NEJ4_GYMJU|nr:hypothetical protein CPB84DRAFT_1750802 [Gymnopilus junonius]